MIPKDFSNAKSGQVIRSRKGYWAFVPAPLPPVLQWTDEMLAILSEAELELAKLTSLTGYSPFPRLLVQPFIRAEAVLSSRIEGTRASLVDLYTYEFAPYSFVEPGNDVREVHNYVRALDYGLDRPVNLPVSLRLIRELHTKLLENVRVESLTPGNFRTSQNWIGSTGSTIETATYVPPPVDEMLVALDALEKFFHADAKIPVLARVGLIHYQFEAIYPFLDGNGRVGRLLSMLLLSEWGILPQPLLTLSAYFERHRQEYYDHLLSVSQIGSWETWLRFFLVSISTQAKESVVRLERLQDIRTQYQSFARADRNPARMEAILDFLFSRPVLTVRQTETALGVPYSAIESYFDKLEAAGLLREITSLAPDRLFMADEILKTLEGGE